MPLRDGAWTPATIAHARLAARLRGRGHSLEQIRRAAREGRLASGYLEDLFPDSDSGHSLEDVARETGLEPELIRRVWVGAGFPAATLEHLTADDVALLRCLAAVLDAGLPLVAFLQLVHVYGQALAHIADAEAKLFHMYVHEPLIREGAPVLEIAEEMSDLASELLPLSGPIMDHVHQRFLRQAIEQDVVAHLEGVAGDGELGRLAVTIVFADLAGYTRLTEEIGEAEALEIVERFVDLVAESLPPDARVIKTIGDEVMVVGADTAALSTGRWASRSWPPSARCPGSASTPAARSIATATTTVARSTWPPGWSHAPRAARCSSPARCGRRRAGTCASSTSAR